LNIGTVEELEAAARDGRLATLPKIGPKTAAKIVAGIAAARERGALGLYHHAAVEAGHLLSAVRSHPDVDRAELAGALRRRTEVVGTVDIVAACRSDPVATAQSFTRMAGVRRAQGTGASVSISYVDGARLSLRCVLSSAFAVALWEETGNAEHVAAVRELLHGRGFSIRDGLLIDPSGSIVPVRDEADLYRAAGLALVPPELREARGEVAAARDGSLPALVEVDDIRGVLHCHSSYSDGKATVAEMARGARARGWRYLGISDHSQAAFYAGGLPRDRVLAQHDEIDELNATLDGFRVLKGIEADILPDGRLDYGDELLDRFEFVIGSIHSRFAMDRIAMTERVVRALDDPRMTILAHPTGRLLLSREPYAIDLAAVLQKAADVGVAVELNADPHRLDLDWRHLQTAKRLGVRVEIGPDAHSVTGLDNMEIGVAIARKGWLEPGDVLNAASADDVLAFARARRTTG